MILTSDLPFARRGGVLGDQVAAAGMITRLVHSAKASALKGSSYRLKDSGAETLPSERTEIHRTTIVTTGRAFGHRYWLLFDRSLHGGVMPGSEGDR